MELIASKEKLRKLFAEFAPIGALPGGGNTRLGYSAEEDAMHRVFVSTAEELGYRTWKDDIGNSYAANFPDDGRKSTVIASHLDSVVEGGPFDGPVGVAAGLMVMEELKARGLEVPVTVIAFRCEESANFKLATLGSELLTNQISMELVNRAVGRDGTPLRQILDSRGYLGDIRRELPYERYIEMHIEQARVLEAAGEDVGIVTAIAAAHRFTLTLTGMADHSGATPMGIRRDALTCASEIILAIEAAGRREASNSSVATVGFIENKPNIINAVPGKVTLQIDIRGIDPASIERVESEMKARVASICEARNIGCDLVTGDCKTPVSLDAALADELYEAAKAEGLKCRKMPSGAGHDAMMFPPFCTTAMVFIPCRDGISHNVAEHTEFEQMEAGIRVILRYLSGLAE